MRVVKQLLRTTITFKQPTQYSIINRYASQLTQATDSASSPSVSSLNLLSDSNDSTVPDTIVHNTGIVSGLPDGFTRRKVQIYKPAKTAMSSYGDKYEQMTIL